MLYFCGMKFVNRGFVECVVFQENGTDRAKPLHKTEQKIIVITH